MGPTVLFFYSMFLSILEDLKFFGICWMQLFMHAEQKQLIILSKAQ